VRARRNLTEVAQHSRSAPVQGFRHLPGVTWISPVILVILYLAQCAWFIRTQSLTYDEPVHIAEGLDAWRHGRFEQYNDHPPLARLLCTLPIVSEKWQMDVQPLPDGFRVSHFSPNPESMAWRARSVNVLLGLLLAILVWWIASRMFSTGAANLALALFVFSPSLIAHFSVVTTDGAATLLIFATAWQVLRWNKDPSWRRAVLCGLFLGLLLLAKYSTTVMFALSTWWMLTLRRDRIIANPLRWNWSKTAVAVLVAVFVLWAGYFFHVSNLSIRNGTLTATFHNWSRPIVKPVPSGANFSLPVPAGEYIEGFRTLVRHNARGHAAYFLGRVSSRGRWRSYYPVTILLKWPTLMLILCLLGLFLAVRERVRISADLWIMTSFPVLYLLLASFAHFNIGERHILPLYPFALLFAGFTWEFFRRAGIILVVLLISLNAADALRYAPGYLSYFNIFVRPAESYRLLTDSNLDWGQGLLAVRQYQREHPDEQIWLAYFGSVEPNLYGIEASPLAENQLVSGTVIVSATNLSGQFLKNPSGYHWVLRYPRKAILDHSMHVYRIDGS
jgi:hypothetical protein